MVTKRFVLALAVVFCGMLLQAQPSVRHYSAHKGCYSIKRSSSVSVEDEDFSPLVSYASKYFARKGKGDIVISLDANAAGHPEGYVMDITSAGICIKAADYAGAFYGLQQILRMMPEDVYKGRAALKYPVNLPCCHIEDWPEFPYRGVMLDVARVWVPLESLYRLVDNIALQNLNVLHLHLTDDEAWRVEIKSHPSLAKQGGFRGPGCKVPAVFGKYDEVFGGYYTQEQLKALVAYSNERSVTIIPEIDMPGHSRAIGAVMPEILCNWQPDTSKTAGFDYRGVWCVSKPENYKLIDDILTEICEIFPSQYIHIGGDEVGMNNWLECPDCKALMKAEGFEDAHALEDYFMRRITAMVIQKGRTPVAWWDEDVIKDNLPEGSVVYGWQSMASSIRALNKGRKTVLAPAHYCYLDMYQDEREHANTWGGVVDYDKIMSLADEIEGLDSLTRSNVMGISGAFWGETCTSRDPHTNAYQDFMLFPRLLAIARVSWNPAAARVSVPSVYKQLTEMNIRFRIPMPSVSYENDKITASVEDGAEIYYIFKGVKKKYTHPISTSEPWLYSFVAHKWSGRSEAAQVRGRQIKPALVISSSMPEDSSKPFGKAAAYEGVSHTGCCPKVGDWIQFDFEETVNCSYMVFKTGYPEFPSAVVASGDVYVSEDGQTYKKTARLENGQTSFSPGRAVKSVRIISDRHGNGHYMVVIQSPEIYE